MHKISNETLDHGCHIRHQISYKTSNHGNDENKLFGLFYFVSKEGQVERFSIEEYRSESVVCAVAQFFGGDTASEIHFKKSATFLRNTWCALLRITFLEIMGDSGESTTSSTRKRKRVKLKCLVSGCNGTFDDDFTPNITNNFTQNL